MKPRRFLLLVLAAMLVLTLLPSALAQTEVDRAAGEVERAAVRRAAAQTTVDAWAVRRGSVHDELVAALFGLQQTSVALEAAAFEMFELRDRILSTEQRVRILREVAETRAVESYMGGTGSSMLSMWSASSFEESVLLEETAAAARRADLAGLEELATARQELATLHDDYQVVEQSLRVLREESLTQKRSLEDLLAQVDERYREAYRGLDEADVSYQQAVSAWEAAQRRRAARAGVEPWRSLVEQYFPTELVDEALAVMKCESGGDPDAVHADSDATGLFQFLAPTWAFASVGAGFPGGSRFDAEANVAAAAWLVDHSIRVDHPAGRWGHWVCQP
jgi:hypothetical protein